MKKAIFSLILLPLICLCGEPVKEPVVVRWSQHESGKSYFSAKPEKGVKLVRVEWPAFLAEFPVSWTRTEDGWKQVKTPVEEPEQKQPLTLDMHIPPIRHAGEGLIIVTPPLSAAPSKT